MLSLLAWPKVITLSGFYCNCNLKASRLTVRRDSLFTFVALSMNEIRLLGTFRHKIVLLVIYCSHPSVTDNLIHKNIQSISFITNFMGPSIFHHYMSCIMKQSTFASTLCSESSVIKQDMAVFKNKKILTYNIKFFGEKVVRFWAWLNIFWQFFKIYIPRNKLLRIAFKHLATKNTRVLATICDVIKKLPRFCDVLN